MFWAHDEACRSAVSLSLSGMPPADPALLGPPPTGFDLDPPPLEALPAATELLARRHGVPPERVLVTCGGSGAMHLAALRWFRGGARVVTELPSYEPFRALPALLGAEVVAVPRRLEDGWRLDPAALRAALGAGPAHLFLCSPHNPTGAADTEGELRERAALADAAGGVLVSNEVYAEFVPPEERVHAALLAPNAVSLGSLTKAYGLGALRIGWMVLGEGLAEERSALTDLAYLTYVDPPTPSLRAAARALERLEALAEPLRHLERTSRPHLERWLRESEHVDGVLGPRGLSAFPRVRGVEDTHALARFLAEEAGVDVVPGEFFGTPGHLRVGYGLPEETLLDGLERLERGLAGFAARAGQGRVE